MGKKSKKQDPDVNIVSKEENEKKSTSLKVLMKKQFKENILLITTIIAVILAVVIGFLIRSYTNLTPPQKAYFGFPGEIFLRMLKFITLPLISSSVITGIASLGGKKAGKIASRAFTYYFTTTFSAVCLGIILVIIIKPGLRNQEKVYGKNPIGGTISPIDTVLDLIRLF
jgi:Na+/H+-dicarboxylate symporter